MKAAQGKCDLPLRDFWAEQNCTLKYGSWTYDGNLVDIKFFGDETEVDVSEFRRTNPIKVRAKANPRQSHFAVWKVSQLIYHCCRMGQAVEYSKSKYTQPRSAPRIVTLYMSSRTVLIGCVKCG